jgi:hypothetical protein
MKVGTWFRSGVSKGTNYSSKEHKEADNSLSLRGFSRIPEKPAASKESCSWLERLPVMAMTGIWEMV